MNRKSSIVNRQFRWVVIGLILLAFALFLPPYNRSFVGDDFVQFGYVWGYMARPFSALHLLNPYVLLWYYRPIQNWWFLGNSLLFGFTPFPYYAVLSGLHALAICLVHRTARQLRLSPVAALAITALFAIHGHWVDVVGWISSVAIVLAAVFNLAAVSTYLTFLENKEVKWLGATAVFFLLALITHEESFILLPILLIINRLPITDYRLRPTAYGHRLTDYRLRLRETLFFSGLFVLTAVYLYIQFTRPNLTLEADKIGLTGYLTHIRLGEIGRFVIDTVIHMTLWFNLPGLLGSFELVMAALVVMGLALWFWRGSNLVRLGLLWAGLHLGFIYFALWTQKPELYAGRHIYQAGIGLLWAIGASIDWLFHKVKQAKSAKKRLKRPNNRLRLTHYGLSILITAVLIANIRLTHNIQKGWLQRAERYQKAEAQVKAILPQVNDRTRIYATRFPITPTFLPATFQVWYETTIDRTGGGDLAQLSVDGKANRDAYVFDYQDGNVYNLMPELQAHEETVFVWAGDGRIEQLNPQNQTNQPLDDKLEPILAGPPDDLRLSIVPPDTDATAGTWTSLVYLLTVPQDSQLQFSLHTKDAAEFRVRVLGDDTEWKTLWETAVTTPNQWTDITIPMDNYWGQAIVIRLETIGNGLWGNPRFTVK